MVWTKYNMELSSDDNLCKRNWLTFIIRTCLFCFFLIPQMYLVIFPEGTRYNPEIPKVIADSQSFAEKEGKQKKFWNNSFVVVLTYVI